MNNEQQNGERKKPSIVLAMPGYGNTAIAAAAFHYATKRPEKVYKGYEHGSLLAQNFNKLWCLALNLTQQGYPIEYFAMQHSDVEPQPGWLDVMIEELEDKNLDMLGAVIPIKDRKGLTSLALANDLCEEHGVDTCEGCDACDQYKWRPYCRLTMHEVYSLPPTFTSTEVGRQLLINTGLWVCKFDLDRCNGLGFTINDRICFDPKREMYYTQVEPEDWNFSKCCHARGWKIGATRLVNLTHTGPMAFPNSVAWGSEHFDTAYVEQSVIPEEYRLPLSERFPHEINGWLMEQEGDKLAELAADKRVLELGSYCGKSTVCMARTADHVVAVDPHDGRGTPRPRDTSKEFLCNLERYGVADKVTSYYSIKDVYEADGMIFDLAFIDAAHDYDSVRADIESVVPMLAEDGLIAFHDYRDRPGDYDGNWDEGVQQAVDEFVGMGAEIIERCATLAIVKPPAPTPLTIVHNNKPEPALATTV